MAEAIETSVRDLKAAVQANDGRNVATGAFRARVERLISAFYDDIGTITTVPIDSLFDLFVIKVLYVEWGSRDASVVDYLGGMLTRYLYARELFPMETGGRPQTLYFSDVLKEMQQGPRRCQNLFEAYRRYGDNALFVSGVLPRSLRRRRPGRLGGSQLVDRGYYVTTGKACYRLAAEHNLAEFTQQRPTLHKLSDYFEVYMDALNEVSERYVLGFDLNLIADKMLDSLNLYRRTGEQKYLENVRRYAAILRLDQERVASLFRRGSGRSIGPGY